MSITLDAINNLLPNAIFSLEDGTIYHWGDSRPQPTDAEIAAEVTRLQAEYAANQYQRDRQYPSIGDQLDMLFHAIEAGALDTTSEFFTTLKAVKDANPKA